MPEGAGGQRPMIREVFPYLCVRDAAAALEFYTEVFGAEELLRLTDARGRIAHAELKLGHELEALSSEEIKQRFEAEQRA